MTSSPATQRILVVEDDGDLRRLIRTALLFEGFDVTEAADGLDALRRLDDSPPDLVILDLMLPVVSGLVVQEEIAAHAHLRSIPVVIVTASTQPLDDLNVPCILRKPISPETLIAVVRKCLAVGAVRGVS